MCHLSLGDSMDVIENTSVIIVTYNHQEYIENCLKSLFLEGAQEIIVVDNASTDITVEIIEKNFPQVTLIKNHENKGFSEGINQGVANTNKDYLVIINPDTYVSKNSIPALLEPLVHDKNLIINPQVLIEDGSKINTCGNIVHFTGLSFTRCLNQAPEYSKGEKSIKGMSGVCFAIHKDNYQNLGGFCNQFFVYMEDAELSWRANVKGIDMVYVPQSIIYHQYGLKVGPQKVYYLEKGRYIILRRYYTFKEYLILFPSFFMTEILTWGYAILNGWEGIKYKCIALKDGLSADVDKKNSNRKELIKSLDYKIPEDQLSFSIFDIYLKRIANLIYINNLKIIGYYENYKDKKKTDTEDDIPVKHISKKIT